MNRMVLMAFREGEPDRQCILDEGVCVIGRSPRSTLVLPDETVSRHHAELRLINGKAVLDDRESTNGIFLNGERIKHAAIQAGDFFTIGVYTLVLRAVSGEIAVGSGGTGTVCIAYDEARRLHQEALEKRCPEHFSILYMTALLLGEPLPANELLERMLNPVVTSLKARRGAVLMYTGSGLRPEIIASVPAGGTMPVSQALVDYVLQARTALRTSDAGSDPRFAASGTVLRQRVGPAMCVPVCGSNQTAGLLYVDSDTGHAPFSSSELEFLVAMGHIAGLALERDLIEKQAVSQNRLIMLGQAVAGMSHDVRSLLACVKGGVDLMRQARHRLTPESTEQACTLIQRGCDRVMGYLDDVLAFVRDPRIDRQPTCVSALINDVLDAQASYARDLGVALVNRGGGHEPASLDGQQIHRVLMNIVKNGIEACQFGGGTVSVSTGRRADTLMIVVEDTGVGMSQEDIDAMPRSFFTTKGEKGTGLGMAVSFSIVERHNGRIAVSSTLGKGTRFTILLPGAFERREGGPAALALTPAYDAYKRCPECGAMWETQEAFLSDTAVTFAQYEVQFDDLGAGQFLFDHACGTTLAVPAGDFRHFYNGPIFQERLTGTEECPEYCLHKEETRSCVARCACAYVREVMRIIVEWPKP